MKVSKRQQQITLNILKGFDSPSKLAELVEFEDVTTRTIQRDLAALQDIGYLDRHGEGRGVHYIVATKGLMNIDISTATLESMLATEDRPVVTYDFERLPLMAKEQLFSTEETTTLFQYDEMYKNAIQHSPDDIVRRERERITVELSWKSSMMEGNTYSLLETETLFKEGLPSSLRSDFETNMVINHKKALDFATENPDIFISGLGVQAVIELHKLLVKDLDISHTLRDRLVSITGSTYKPLSNPHKIKEELERFCETVNSCDNVYEKSLLAYFYIPYLQPFNDGNKRTGRILANALLLSAGSFPLSLRAVDPNEYKLAMLSFYELGLVGPIKRTYIDQAEYAKNNYIPSKG